MSNSTKRETYEASSALVPNTSRSGPVKSSNRDTETLAKHGKRQQLNRTFGFISAVAFSSIILSSWEAIAVTVVAAFTNGGPVALFYGFFLSWIGTLMLCLSLAEMASMAPVASAQYYFVALLTNDYKSKLLSWIAGWITVFAWQANMASVGYLISSIIQGMVILNYEDYTPERWHGTMIFWAIVVVSTGFNIFGIKFLPHLETLVGILHICLWFVFTISLVYLSPHRPASSVFTDFENNSGWVNNGVSWCLGLLTVTYPFIGFEGVCHIGEEITNAPLTVPRSMVLSVVINGVLALGFIVGLLFSVTDIKSALESPTNLPILAIFDSTLEDHRATTAFFSLLALVAMCAEMGMIASTSRLTWAFARDKGLPFSSFFARVNPRYRIPINAVLLNAFVAMLLSLINIASSTAFSAIISLTTLALYLSYMLPIGIMIVRRLGRNKPQFGPFNLGRFGLAVNVLAMIWGIFTVVFVVFPTELPVTADNMNYSSLVFGSALIFSLSMWFVYGKRIYHGSVNEFGEDDAVPLS